MRDRAFLLGNVDPVNVFFNGTEEEMRRAVRRCYRKAWDNPCGFMLAPGCGTAYGTPVENALIYMDEVFGYLPPVANPPSKLPLLKSGWALWVFAGEGGETGSPRVQPAVPASSSAITT